MSGIAQDRRTASALTEPMRSSPTGPGAASVLAVVTSRLADVPEPAPLTAATLNVYAVSADSPVTRARVPGSA